MRMARFTTSFLFFAPLCALAAASPGATTRALSLDEAMAATMKRTKALARRQLAWFRRDLRVRWFEAGEGGAADIADELLEYLSG